MSVLHRRFLPDALALVALTALCALFFWRLLTPVPADQASLTQGDFSGQFVAFGGYQYARWSQGEVPLWNPYNNGGLPFIADTQAAVFYPPRLLTIALSALAGVGWTYHALQLEMIAHVWLYTLAMYAFVRRLTGAEGVPPGISAGGAFIAAVVGGYGGYLTGYPPLQLALLEAGVWLPLAALGIAEATRHPERPHWLWLVLTGWALGMSWLAGHPQTSWFLTYLLLAYYGWQVIARRYRWWVYVVGVGLFGMLSVGVVAVTLFPGIEYLLHTSRNDLSFEAKGGGFPYRDFVQVLIPGVMSLWSPLYVGVIGLALAVVALWRRAPSALFWGGVAGFALAFSVGADGALYHALYNTLPGLRFFRGQERAAYLYAHSLAILAGWGAVALAQVATAGQDATASAGHSLRVALGGLFIGLACLALIVLVLWLRAPQSDETALSAVIFSLLMAGMAWLVLPWLIRRPALIAVVGALVVLELFSVNIDNSNYDPIPPDQQLTPPPLLDVLLADDDLPFRVDGFRGIHDNYGSLYGVADIHGISPLFLTGVQEIIETGLPDERAWELFAVRYVYSDWEALVVPWERIGQGQDRYGDVTLFRLTAPRPYAHLVYDFLLAEDDAHARRILADPDFDPRALAILERAPTLTLPYPPPEGAGTTITHYAPETLTVIVNTPENAILSLAHVDYNGWQATVDGQPAEIIRAYGGLMALEVPAGVRTVTLTFAPLTYRVGALVSLATWGGLAALAVALLIRRVVKAIRTTRGAYAD